MIASKTLIGGSLLAAAVITFPLASYAGDMGDDYHHGYGEEGFHHKWAEKGHVMQGHLRVDVYIHKVEEKKHKKFEKEHMKWRWEHERRGGWEHEKMYAHHGDWDQGYEHHDGIGPERYGNPEERQGRWQSGPYEYESHGDQGGYGDEGGDSD